MNNLKKIIILASVIILFLIIIFTIIPNRNKRHLEVKPEELMNISTTTEKTISESNDFYTINIKYPSEIRDVKSDIEKYVKSNLESIKSEWSLDSDLYKNELKLREDFPDRPIMKYEYNVSYDRFESNSLNLFPTKVLSPDLTTISLIVLFMLLSSFFSSFKLTFLIPYQL